MERFEGTVVHPQFWPEDLDYDGKQVVVIGSGATAVTLVPAMAERAAHVTMLQRSPSYVVSMPAANPIANFLRRVLPERFAGPVLRWMNALFTQGTYELSHRRPALVKKMMRKGIERELPAGYDIDTHFTPTYNPWDQRVCLVPDGDLFAAIRHGAASVVTDHIETFTEPRHPAEVRRRARRRPRRHRHRARGAVPGRDRGVRRRRGGRPHEAHDLQGHDARGRPQPGVRHRLHERVVDAEGRPDQRLRGAPAEPPARHRAPPVHPGQPLGSRRTRRRSSRCRRATSPEPSTDCRSRGTPSRGRSTRATWPTTGPCGSAA